MNDINTRIENIRKGIAKRAAAMKAKVQKQGFQFKPFSDKQKTINEYGLYSWDMESPEDAVIKEFDHCMDSDRYYCYTFLRRRLRWKY